MRRKGSKNHTLGTYEANKISLSCFDDKRYILKNGINTLAYEHKDIKMINLDSITNENNEKYNEKWLYIPDHPYKIVIIGDSVSGKTNTLLNLLKEQDNRDVIDKIYLYPRDLSEPKYQFLIKKREDAGIKNWNNPNAFILCSNTIDDIYEDMIIATEKEIKKFLLFLTKWLADIMTNKRFQAIIKELLDAEN